MDQILATTERHAAPAPIEDAPAASTLGEIVNITSWNLLRRTGAQVQEVLDLVEADAPDILLLQEATAEFDRLPDLLGGHYARAPLPGRPHGVACWSPHPFARQPLACALQPGLVVRRLAQIIDFGPFAIANVHLSHGQVLNRKQLRRISQLLPHHRALVMGDFNLVGPTLLRGFHDVGPRGATHRMVDLLPIRIDRCLVRGFERLEGRILPRGGSDHHPIAVRLRQRGL